MLPSFLGDLEKGSARQGGGTNPRLINMMELVNPDNYPELAFERNVEGAVRVAVKVNNDGLATKCDTIGKPAPELGGPTSPGSWRMGGSCRRSTASSDRWRASIVERSSGNFRR